MNNHEEMTPKNSPSRRKFVLRVGILSVFAAIATATGLPFFSKKKVTPDKGSKKKTVKMLTQDGRLVEIDESLMTVSKKKVTNTELQQWIKK